MPDEDKKGQSGNAEPDPKDLDKGSDKPEGVLDKLLAEWDQAPQGTDSSKSDKDKPAGTGDGDIAKRLELLESALTRTSYDADMQGIVKEVKGDLDVDDWIVESWVNRKADSDPRLVKLWEERGEKKSQFAEMIKALGPEFQTYAKERILPTAKDDVKDDDTETKDKDNDKGLTAAVRSSREAKPTTDFENVKLGGLSGSEFALKKAEIFRAMKSGKLKAT